MYKLLINIILLCFIFVFSPAIAKEPSFVSTAPALTEIMYALGAQDMLKAVSAECSFPPEAKNKPIIGDYYLINEQMLLTIKPDYFLARDTSEMVINKYRRFGVKPLCLKFSDINSVYENIFLLGKLTNREEQASIVVEDIKNKITKAKEKNKNPNKKILYVLSTEPFITIGGKSFITSIINASGNYSVTQKIDTSYPAISIEYAIQENPDIVILDYYCSDIEKTAKFFPNAKIIKMTEAESDIIERPSTRIYQGVEFFATLSER